jgi:hypothetical protein
VSVSDPPSGGAEIVSARIVWRWILESNGLDRVRHMAKDVTLYVGSTAPNYAKCRFRDAHEWEGVRSQIINAMNMGKGTIEIDRKGDKVVYVYSPFLAVSWVETGV